MYADDFIDQLKAYIRLNRQVAGMGSYIHESRSPSPSSKAPSSRMDEDYGRVDRRAPTN